MSPRRVRLQQAPGESVNQPFVLGAFVVLKHFFIAPRVTGSIVGFVAYFFFGGQVTVKVRFALLPEDFSHTFVEQNSRRQVTRHQVLRFHLRPVEVQNHIVPYRHAVFLHEVPVALEILIV